MARGRGRPKQAPKSKAPAGWTEEAWLEQQRAWKEDPIGPLLWALTLNLKNERGDPMEWDDRRFLVDPLCDMHPKQVYQKCTQVGLSVLEIFKAIFVAMVYGLGIIYTMPTYKLLLEFHKTKIERLIKNNPNIAPTGDANIGIFTYDNAGYVLFRGTMGDSQDISLTADLIVADEADRSDLSVIEGLESRMMSSPYKWQWWFTNPTFPDVGTDKKWALSDKREWHVTCPHCGEEQMLDYEENIATEVTQNEHGDDVERHYYYCRVCHQEWENDRQVRQKGRWIATDPGKEWHGYHISQMCAPWISAKEMVEAERNKSAEFFWNYMLGKPALVAGTKVDRTLIMQNVVPKDDARYEKRNGAKKFMGVDVNRLLSVVIGNEHGITKMLYLGDDKGIPQNEVDNLDSKKSKWGKLVALMNQEGIHQCVIDNLPASKQLDFQKRFRYRTWRCIYDTNDTRDKVAEMKRDIGVVNVHRTKIIDAVIGAFGDGSLPIFVDEKEKIFDGDGDGKDANCYVRHFTNLFQIGLDGQDENLVKKDRQGNVIRTWEHTGRDDFVHSTVYYLLARQIGTPLGGGASFMAGDFKGPLRKDDDDDDFPGEGEDERTFFG